MEGEEARAVAGDFPYSKLLGSLPKYNGIESWHVHENALVQWRVLNNVARADHDWQKTALLYSLTGKAAERASTIGRGTVAYDQAAGFNAMLTLLRNIFSPRADSEISRVAFRCRRQSAREDIVSYLTAKISLWRCAYPDPLHQQYDQLLDASIDGMVNKVIKRIIRRENPRTQEDLIITATNAVAAERYAYAGGYSESTSLDGLTTIIETTQKRRYNLANDEVEPMEIDQMKETRKCYNCNTPGHLARDCRKPKKEREKSQGNKGQKDKKSVKCFNCNGMGHFARDCRKPRKKKAEVNKMEEVVETDGSDGEE